MGKLGMGLSSCPATNEKEHLSGNLSLELSLDLLFCRRRSLGQLMAYTGTSPGVQHGGGGPQRGHSVSSSLPSHSSGAC